MTTPSPPPPSTPVPNRRRAWLIVGMLVVLMMINFMDKLALGLAAKPIITEFGLTMSEYGLASSSFFFLFFVASLLIGFVANRVSTTRLLAVLAVVWGIAQLSMLAATGLAVIVLSRMLLGAAEGPTFALVNHASYKWLPDRDRSLGSALLTAGAALGVLVGAPSMTYLIVHHGWRSVFLVTGLISVVWCLGWLVVGREGPLTATTDQRHATATSELDGLRTSYWRTITTGTFLASSLAAFAAYWAVAIGLSFGPLYLEDIIGLSLTGVSNVIVVKEIFTVVIGYIAIALLIKSLLGRGVSTRVARGLLGGGCLVLGGVALVLMVALPGTGTKIAMNIASALAVVAFPIGATVCAEITPARQRGGVLGTYAALYALAGVIAPAITGRLAASNPANGLNTSYLILGGLLITSGLAAAMFVRPARDARRLAEHARQHAPRSNRGRKPRHTSEPTISGESSKDCSPGSRRSST